MNLSSDNLRLGDAGSVPVRCLCACLALMDSGVRDFTQIAHISPVTLNAMPVRKMPLYVTWSCMNRPVIGPSAMAMLLVSP